MARNKKRPSENTNGIKFCGKWRLYNFQKERKGTWIWYGNSNRKHVMLTYTCAKLLTMISKFDKIDMIRKFYIDLEKLIITYKDNIIWDL